MMSRKRRKENKLCSLGHDICEGRKGRAGSSICEWKGRRVEGWKSGGCKVEGGRGKEKIEGFI